MLTLDPAFLAAMLTIEQTAPSFAEAMAFIQRQRTVDRPPKPKPARPLKVQRAKVYRDKPVTERSPIALKSVKVMPLLMRGEYREITPPPSAEEIEAACGEIRSRWNESEHLMRRASLDADMRRVGCWWSRVNGGLKDC